MVGGNPIIKNLIEIFGKATCISPRGLTYFQNKKNRIGIQTVIKAIPFILFLVRYLLPSWSIYARPLTPHACVSSLSVEETTRTSGRALYLIQT